MSQAAFSRPPLADSLSVVLPTREETLLLRACLFSSDSARQAWKEWKSRATEVEDGLVGNNGAVKNLRPLVFDALRCHGMELDKESWTFLRSAYLKEELRSKIFRRICRDILLLLAKEGIPTIVLKGTALAETVYKNPVLRHSHDIEILIKDQDISRAATLLRALDFKGVEPKSRPGISHFTLEHKSALPLVLHSRLFQIPYHNTSLAEMWSRRQDCHIADVRTHILAPCDNLLHVCGHAFYSRSRQSLRWVSDAWLVIDRHRDLDWDLLLDCARQSRLVLPLSVTLSYLAEELDAAIPATFFNRLFAAASKSTAIEREFALFGARSASAGSFRNLIRKARGWRGRASVLKWMLCPSPDYLFWVQQIRRSWLLPFHYVYRPARYAAQRTWLTLAESTRGIRFRKDRLFARVNNCIRSLSG
ncbi:MAG TPA: nucleotidyltransferase family protein [Candidatus Binatia bacterium]|jgi:hypothetical protein